MRVKFLLPGIGPLSINQVYYGNRAHGWTKEAKDWSYQLMYQISQHEAQIKMIRDFFDPKRHGLELRIVIYFEDFIKSGGGISSRTQDIDNVLKPLIDILFNKKFHGTSVPYTCQNFNIDDKYIIDIHASKRHGAKAIEVEVAVVPLPS